MKHNEITNNENILDSRDIQDRYDSLTQEIEDAFFDAGRESFDFLSAWEKSEYKTDGLLGILVSRNALDECVIDEWKTIRRTFIDNMSDFYEWDAGMTFLRDSYMDKDWAEEEVKELGLIPKDLDYLIRYNINFQGILEDLQQGYNYVDFDGVKYWYQEM